MAVMKQQGGRQALHRQAVAILLACSTLSIPAVVSAQTPYPASAAPPERNIYSPTNPVNDDGREGTWATAPAIGVTPLRTGPATAARAATSSNPAAAPASTVLPGTPTDQAGAATDTGDTTDAADTALLTTGAIGSGNSTPVNDPPYVDDLNQPFQDLLDSPADDLVTEEAPVRPEDSTGIRIGTLLLRPSIGQSINRETIRDGDTQTKRNYSATTIRGTLTSDWSRHQLSVTGETIIERNFGGGDQPKPEGEIDANLRLDLANETIANISAGYDFEREENSDPNAIGGASVQSGVHQFSGGVTLERDAGILRGLAGLGVNREIYGDARLQDGSSLDLGDRDHTLVDGRLRLGYELSPALIPFVEVRGGRNFYDRTRDSAGYERSSWTYGGRGGVEFDFSEKLRGELGLGYERVDYDDSRLAALDGLTVDGRTVWSPQRGTELELALRTTLQDATAPGASGWVEYNAAATLTHQLRHNLVGRLTGGATERVFPQASDETTWITGAGLTWSLNRYLDLTSAVEYEYTDRASTDTRTLRAGLGLTLRR
ncbi:MAG: outer membrane beta-barrel protein [Pseudorhizobium sp.]